MTHKPGRNDPCHCGSGSKYKKCCLEKDEATRAAAAAALPVAPSHVATTGPRNDRPVQQVPKPTAAMRKMPATSRRRSV